MRRGVGRAHSIDLFGGSTHCLVFGPEVIGDFAMTAIPQPHDPDGPLVLVRSRLATAAQAPPPA